MKSDCKKISHCWEFLVSHIYCPSVFNVTAGSVRKCTFHCKYVLWKRSCFWISPFSSVFCYILNTKLCSSLTGDNWNMKSVFLHNAYKYFRETELQALEWNRCLILPLWNRKQIKVTSVIEVKIFWYVSLMFPVLSLCRMYKEGMCFWV